MTQPVRQQIRQNLVDGVAHYERGRRRRLAVLGSAAVIMAVAVGAMAWTRSGSGSEQVVAGPTDTAPLVGLEELPPLPEGLRLPTAPPSWTGSEFLWVGPTDDIGSVEMVAYDIERRTWRELPPAPVPIGEGGASAWNGRELIVCCGVGPGMTSQAAAYDPDNNTWRVLPDAPVSGYSSAVWTGDRFVVVASGDGGAVFGGPGAASLDPEAGAWQELPAPPGTGSQEVVWTGEDLVVWPVVPQRQTGAGAIYDEANRQWSLLPEPPVSAWPAIPDVVWVGDRLVVLGGLPANRAGESERMVGAAYDPATSNWSSLEVPLPEPMSSESNLGSQQALWTGQDLLVHVGDLASGDSTDGILLAHDPANGDWIVVGRSRTTALVPLAMADNRVLLQRDDIVPETGDTGPLYLSEPGWRPSEGGPF